jgi:hypothetical protein
MLRNQAIYQTYHPFAQEYKGAKSLAGEDLTGWCLVRANLDGTDLSGCNLTNVDLVGASLKGANTEGVILNNTFLNGANLNGANIKGWQCQDLMGLHTRGTIFDFKTVDVSELTGAHDCHEIVVAMLLREYPNDFEIQQICECILARFITCWHGLVSRVRKVYPHRLKDLEATFTKYPNMQLMHRWELGIAMADCGTDLDKWEALLTTVHNDRFPALVRGWNMKMKRQLRSE